jgi:hypothetical protein
VIITMRRTILTVGVAAVTLVAACSSTSEQVKDQIAEQVQEQLELAEQPAVSCPDDAKAGEGEEFECTLELEGTEIPVAVTFTDDTTFESELVGAVYKKGVLDQGLKDQLSASDIVVESVECPGEDLVVIQADESLQCDAVDADGAEATLTVELDESGSAQIVDIAPKG